MYRNILELLGLNFRKTDDFTASEKGTHQDKGGFQRKCLEKIFKIGRLPFNGSVAYYYNAVRPSVGPDWYSACK